METIEAPDIDSAWSDVEGGGAHEGDDTAGYRTYAVVSGGEILLFPGSIIPEGGKVNFVWQAERDILAVTVVAGSDIRLEDLEKRTIMERPHSPIFWKMKEIGYFRPDLAVLGGTLAHVGSL